jgi:hypothetical protein
VYTFTNLNGKDLYVEIIHCSDSPGLPFKNLQEYLKERKDDLERDQIGLV